VPVVMKNKKAWISDTFINDVFQSGLTRLSRLKNALTR
jgi:hypothetical protein